MANQQSILLAATVDYNYNSIEMHLSECLYGDSP